MKPSVLVAARFLPRLFGRLGERLFVARSGGCGARAVPPEARDARALITIGGLKTDAALIDALPKLGLIACYGTGYEGVDRAAARARGIVVTHGGDTNSTAVAEFAFGLVIATVRGMIRGDRFARAGRWRGDIIERTAITPELAGQRLGIYGLGSIGAKIATRAAAFEMEIGYHNRRERPDVPYAYHPTLIGLATGPTSWSWPCGRTPAIPARSTGGARPRSAPGATGQHLARHRRRQRPCARRWRPAPSPAPRSTSSSASPTSPSASGPRQRHPHPAHGRHLRQRPARPARPHVRQPGGVLCRQASADARAGVGEQGCASHGTGAERLDNRSSSS